VLRVVKSIISLKDTIMAIVTYPAALPKPLINVTRSQSPGFQLKQPLAGPGYVKQMTSDSPATYELSWRMSRAKAVQFISWFRSPVMLNEGANKFTISLDTEFGPQDHTFQLTPDNLLPSNQEAGNVFSYTATAICRKAPIPAVYTDHADLIVLDAYNYRAEIDIAMNQTWPEAL